MRIGFSLKKQPMKYSLRSTTDWPLGLRLFSFIAPVIIFISLLCLYISYATLAPMYQSLLYEKGIDRSASVASGMESTLNELRDNMLSLALSQEGDPQKILARVKDLFQEHSDIIVEICIKDKSGQSVVWLRDGNNYREAEESEISQGPYSVLQQVDSHSLAQGEVALFPAVSAYYAQTPERNKVNSFSVIRMGTPFVYQDKSLVIGISLQQLRDKLKHFAEDRKEADTTGPVSNMNLAYFFDMSGWILFEMGGASSSSSGESYVDLARRGFTGDLGRPGLESTFRPWAVHESYWVMVKDAQVGNAGYMDTSPKHLISNYGNVSASLGYVPVLYAADPSAQPLPIGGIALLLTSSAPYTASVEMLGMGLAVFVVLLFGLPVLFFFIHKRLGVPLFLLARSVKEMLDSKDFATINQKTAFQEHQMLLAACNGLIGATTSSQSALARLTGEVHSVRSNQPVDLGQAVALAISSYTTEYGIVGSSAEIVHVRDEIRRAARAGTDVLVWGETGTGKELVAEAIHQHSQRKNGPLISINCGALDENLLLDVLFGHAKGAFSEAKADRKGAFLTAEGGTLHLDEIGTASAQVQQALLRALSVRRIRPLGTDVEVPFDTRVVAATNVDLREAVKMGTFREDLYYRLAIISIKTPPLRQRKEDIPELAAFCLHEYAAKMGKEAMQLSRGALESLMGYSWPGNVREFKNSMVRAIAFAESNLILASDIIHNDSDEQAQRLYRKNLAFEKVAQPLPAVPFRAEAPEPAAVEMELPTPANLNERQKKVWQVIVRQQSITRAEAQAIIGTDVSSRTVQLDLREMVQSELIHKIGAGPSTRYALHKE